jgi:branched-chain amino acid transport system substrate-binding protein
LRLPRRFDPGNSLNLKKGYRKESDMSRKILIWISMGIFLFGIGGLVFAAEPIKVGVPMPMTGPYTADGLGSYQGVKFAADEVNAAGGLLGRPLEIIRFDIGDLSPELHMQAADKLIGRDKVDVINTGWVGWGQDVTAYGKYDVPFFLWDASIAAVDVYRSDPEKYFNFFHAVDVEGPIAIDEFDTMRTLPYKHPNQKIAIIVTDDAWGREIGTWMTKRTKEVGWEVPVYEIVPYGTTEWGPILTKIRSANPALIHIEVVSPPDVVTFFRQFMKQPTDTMIHTGYLIAQPGFVETLGKEGNGIMGQTAGIPIPVAPTPEGNAWLKKFNDTFNTPRPHASSFAVYTTLMMWADAVKKIGDVKKYREICEYVANTPFKSIVGRTFTFDKDRKIPLSSMPLAHMQIQNGELITVFEGPEKKYLNFEWQVPPWVKR